MRGLPTMRDMKHELRNTLTLQGHQIERLRFLETHLMASFYVLGAKATDSKMLRSFFLRATRHGSHHGVHAHCPNHV